jgi:hypothetical protein
MIGKGVKEMKCSGIPPVEPEEEPSYGKIRQAK